MPGATVTAHYRGQLLAQSVTNGAGWFLLTGVRSGRITLTASMAGYKTTEAVVSLEANGLRAIDLRLEPGELSETISVAAEPVESEDVGRKSLSDAAAQAAPSQNVFNLQRRVVGVLPVRIDVPRAGSGVPVRPAARARRDDHRELRLSNAIEPGHHGVTGSELHRSRLTGS